MRVMVLVKATERSEAYVMPRREDLAEMGVFNQQLVEAGVMLAGDGLKPTSAGKRLSYAADGSAEVLDGPFAETKELVAGYWIWQVSSVEEAVEWLRRAPFRDGEVEVRPFFEAEDFGAASSPELQAAEEELRDRISEPPRP